jgi:hypothetical protein
VKVSTDFEIYSTLLALRPLGVVVGCASGVDLIVIAGAFCLFRYLLVGVFNL